MGRVCSVESAVMSDGTMKSFPDARNAKMATVALTGATIGKTMRRNTPHVVAPSSRALSSSSSGRPR